jgi:hypothetical protein
MQKRNFRKTSKGENRMQNSDGMQKKLKMHAVSITFKVNYQQMLSSTLD